MLTKPEADRYYQPRPETGTTLPDAKTVRDLTLFILNENGTLKLYIMFEGTWKLINTLS